MLINYFQYNIIDLIKCLKAAGVVCKVAKSECSFNYWQCEKTAECIPLAFLCDNVKDCKDHSDENPKRCEVGDRLFLKSLTFKSKILFILSKYFFFNLTVSN